MSKTVQRIQVVLATIAFGLVVALFVFGLVGGQSRDQEPEPTPSQSEGRQDGAEVASGQRMPGMPEKDLGQYERFPQTETVNPDRQLAYEAQGSQVVQFAQSLDTHAAYASQSIEWTACGEGALCATVLAPLDWDEPSGPAVEIAVSRVAGAGTDNQPLFVNPGGPGAGGIAMAQSLQGRWNNYDMIGWDPRGTGESTHVVCGTPEETDALTNLDSSPDDEVEDQVLRDGAANFARQCRDASGDLLDHITTIDVVRDLDLLRHLLGAEKLNYVGVSYGTYVGATYAQLFPNSVGRMILDAAVEITGTDEVPQAAGFELALSNFTAWCAESALCALGDDHTALNARISDFLTGLDSAPVTVGNRQLTQSLAAAGIALFLYSDEEAYRTLAQVLGLAMSGDGASLLQAADLQNSRLDDGSYSTLAYAFPAMLCADWADTGSSSVSQRWRNTFAEAPTMAPNLGMSYTCEFWTADSAPELKLTAEGAPPILVVGTTGDSATPYQQSVSMAEQLSSGTLLTLDGAGHGAVTGTNQCIAEAVDKFLYEGTPPENGKTCSA